MAFTNSPLVVYTKISPNSSNPRNHEIDTISIHCMAGNCSVETCGAIFAPTSRQASSNYGIGSDGRIAMYVEEQNRSWCTSSRDNDNRAVTIEVANDGGADTGWHVSDKAYAALIDLCVDICKRNNIKELKWQANKALIGQVDKQNMTVHRWFANKSCPGDYLYNLHGDIAKKVNERLGVVESDTTTPAVTGTPSTGSAADEKKIWDFFIAKIGNAYGVAGLMGNLNAESALRSNNLQQTYETKLNYSDTTYTAAVDNGKYTNFVKDSAGYGLAQWTYYTRKQALLNYAQSQKKSIGDFEMQLNFLYKELSESYKGVLSDLKNATSVLVASNSVLTKFECPANQGESVQKKRAEYGQAYYEKYATKTSTSETSISSLEFEEGDIVNFTGGKHYSSSNAANGSTVKASKAKITSVAKNAKHPYHCRAVNDSGAYISGVYGWVDAADVSEIEVAVTTPSVPVATNLENGTKLNLKNVALYTSSTAKTNAGTRTGTYYVWSITAVNGRIRITNSTSNVGKAGQVTGWINVDDAKNSISIVATTPTFTSYMVRVNANVLNIRKGAGTNYAIRGSIKNKGAYTIVDEATGKGATKWGLLKSYKDNRDGWISLDYCTKL